MSDAARVMISDWWASCYTVPADMTQAELIELVKRVDAFAAEQTARADHADLKLAESRQREKDAEAQVERLRTALEEIKTQQGRVCAAFELCTHESCRSSYSSWQIAHVALLADPAVQGVREARRAKDEHLVNVIVLEIRKALARADIEETEIEWEARHLRPAIVAAVEAHT